MTDLGSSEWHQLIDACNPPTVEAVTQELSDRFNISTEAAREYVEQALDEDGPVRYDPDLGTWGGVTVSAQIEEQQDSIQNSSEKPEHPAQSGEETSDSGSTLGVSSAQGGEHSHIDSESAGTPGYAGLY